MRRPIERSLALTSIAVALTGLASCRQPGAKPTTTQQSSQQYQKTMDTMKQATSNLKGTLDSKKSVPQARPAQK